MKRLFQFVFSFVFAVIFLLSFAKAQNQVLAACGTRFADCETTACCSTQNLVCDSVEKYCRCPTTGANTYWDDAAGKCTPPPSTCVGFNKDCSASGATCCSAEGTVCRRPSPLSGSSLDEGCFCPAGEKWDSTDKKCVTTGCSTSALCGSAQCGKNLFSVECNLSYSCGPSGGECSAGYTCQSGVCQTPTCSSYAESGGDAECLSSSSRCHNEGGTTVSSPNDCDGATPTCCKFPANANRGGYDCTINGCVLHTGIGAGYYNDKPSCTASGCRGGGDDCAVCPSGFIFDPSATREVYKCTKYNPLNPDRPVATSPTYQNCSADMCKQGSGCGGSLGPGFASGQLPCTTSLVGGKWVTTCQTAFGQINTNVQDIISKIFRIILSIAGGIAVLLIIYSAYKLIISQGNPEKTKDAQEQLTAAIVGLVLIIFTFTFMNFVGVDILNIFNQ